MTARPREDAAMAAREAAFQMAYALEQGGQTAREVEHWYGQAHPLSPAAAERAHVLLEQVVGQRVEIETLLDRHSIGWRLNRMSVVDRSLLKVAVAEILRAPGESPRAVIQAALKLAHKFSQPEAAGFIQGLLEAISRTLASSPEVTPHAG